MGTEQRRLAIVEQRTQKFHKKILEIHQIISNKLCIALEIACPEIENLRAREGSEIADDPPPFEMAFAEVVWLVPAHHSS